MSDGKRRRLDVSLVERGLAPSRAKAQELVADGSVEVLDRGTWRTVTQTSFQIDAQDVRIKADAQVLRFVSRGGLKLEGALTHLKLNVLGLRCLDIGQSTGGFTDCLLHYGASEVFGVDVGHGQLAEQVMTDPRVLAFEGVHVKDLAVHPELMTWLKAGVNLCVADLSFISLTKAIPFIAEALLPGCLLLALVKPQFEVGAENLDRNGVADPKHFDDVEGRVLLALEKYGFSIGDYFPSPLKGQDGNQEFFVFATRR